MVVKSHKTRSFFEGELSPCIAFVTGHPHREVFQPDEDGLISYSSKFAFLKFENATIYLSFFEVGILNDLGWELKLEKHQT